MRYEFLEFVLDTDQRTLRHPAGELPLRRQSFLVLQYLVERAPAVVSKDQLLDAIWGHQSISSSAVAQTIRELREALGDHADDPRAIETRHRIGYRFIAELSAGAATASHEQTPDAPPFAHVEAPPSSRVRAGLRPLVMVPLALIALIALLWAAPWQHWGSQAASPGWPSAGRARDLANAAMQAARYFDTGDALAALDKARGLEDVPRLALWQASLHLLRGERVLATQALSVLESRKANLRRVDHVILSALQHEVAGRYGAAMEDWRIAYEIDPRDVDVGLAFYSAQVHEASPELRDTFERLSQLDGIPPPRLLLMSAQLAGDEGDIQRQLTQSQAAQLASDTRWQVLSALAEAEHARALKASGKIAESRAAYSNAISTLEAHGLLRPAIATRLEQIDLVLAQGEMEGVNIALDTLQARVREGGDDYAVGRLLHARGRLARRLGVTEDALAYYAAAAQQHEIARNWDGVASALSAAAGPLQRIGRNDEARAYLDRALRLAEQSGTASVRANVRGNLANLAMREARYADARRNYDAALTLFRELHDRRMEAVTLGHLSNLSQLEGDLRSADKLNREALKLFRELKQPADTGRILINLSAAALDRGALSDAAEFAEEAGTIFAQLDDPNRLSEILAIRADVRLHRADLPGAGSLLDAAEALENVDLEKQSTVATLRGRAAMLRGEPRAARDAFALALANRTTTGALALQRASRLDLARVDLAEGRLAVAEQAAIAISVEGNEDSEPPIERDARLLLAQVLIEQDRHADAERELAVARSLLDGAPNFASEFTWALLRSRLDGNPERMQRLQWLIAHAREHDQQLLELRALGALHAEGADQQVEEWRERVRALGLLGLLERRMVIGS